MSGFMLRLTLLFSLTVMSGADDLFPEENFFQGLELGSQSTDENFFSGVAVAQSSTVRPESEAETEIRSYWSRISNQSGQRPTPDRMLRDLQDKVRTTEGNDAEALYEFSRALMYWSREPAFRSQMSSMNRMAGIYLQKAMVLTGDQSAFALKARYFYQRQFGSNLSPELILELEQAESAAASGNLTEAEGVVRRLAHQTSFRDRRVLRLMEGILRSKATSESDPEKAANFTAEANFIARSLAETGAEEEAIMAQIEDSPTGQSQSPATVTTDQRAVDTAIDQAYQLDKTNKPGEALTLLKELNRNTGYRSAKARYYLGRQLIRMARLPEFRSQQDEFLAQGNQHLTEARNLRSRHLEQFPDNARFAEESEKLYREIDRINLANDQEKAVDNLIGKALELNGFSQRQEALAELNRAVTLSERKCAKSLYFLGKQHILLNNPSQARTELLASKALRTQHLNVYTQNEVWGTHAANLLDQMTATAETAPVPTPTPRPDPEVTPTPDPAPQVVADGSTQTLVKPLSGSVTSAYGMRTHPIHRTQRMHGGLDIGARRGTPIKAMANGKIIHVGWISGYGKTVKVRYDNGYESLFAHMHNYTGQSGESRVNQRVRVGESVGQVNSTGGSTGDHLHLELRRNGNRISPAEVLGKQNRRGETI